MSWSKDEYARAEHAYMSAFQNVAAKLGEDHPMVKLMGGLAWGRHEKQGGPDSNNLRDRAVAYGYVAGCERMLVKWCNLVGESDARRTLTDAVAKAKRERKV